MHSRLRLVLLSSPALFLSLAACEGVADHPSLAPRAIERFSVAPPPVEEVQAPLPPDADRAARIAALIDRANGADARFQTELAETRGSVGVASGAAVGSEAWVVAQQAISRADARRTAVSESLADLDRMQIDGPESQALDQALASVSALEQGERSALLALRDRLSAP